MASKAKLTLSQFLFRRNNNASNNETGKSEQTSHGGNNGGGGEINTVNSHTSSGSSPNRKMSVGSSGGTVSVAGGKQAQKHLEYVQKQEILKAHHLQKSAQPSMDSSQQRQRQQQQHHQTPHQQVQQQLQGILKKPGGNGKESIHGGSLASRTHRSSLHRSKSNPNPSNNPLKEVSWSCPTLEKRREVILNYFERIILENKQEQNLRNKATIKPNIPCEGGNGGEPIYEEILDLSGLPPPSQFMNSSERTGSLKPKLGPKKVRMNIPQDQQNNDGNGQSPIYDKVLCRSHSMLESSTSSTASLNSSGFYDIAPSTTASISSSGSHSLYENFRPSSYYAPSSSSESDYGIVGGGGLEELSGNGNNGKIQTTRRSHSFHDNYRTSGSYNIQTPQHPLVDTDQLYAKVCKRKKLKVPTDQYHQPPQQNHQRPLSYPTTKADCKANDDDSTEIGEQLRVQVSCGNVVTMIPVMMPCSSSFSTSCLSLSSSSDNNNDDMTITTSISNNHGRNNHNGHHMQYDLEKNLPDKHIAYTQGKRGGDGASEATSRISAAIRNRNNLSVIHLLASYDPAKEIEEFIPTPTFTAIIDSTECAPKSISVPVRVDFSSSNSNNTSSTNSNNKKNEEDSHPSSRQPLMVTNCSFGYDNDAFEDDDDGENNNHHKNLSSSGTSSTSGADDGDDGSSATSDSDTDEDDHHAQKYSFTNSDDRGVLTHRHHRVKSITFQDETTAKDLLLLTTSESEDDEEFCEHKSLLDMSNSTKADQILDDSSGKEDKYNSLMDDEDRGFDSFLDDSENNGSGDSPSSFRSDNLRNQRTFAQMTQGVPQEQLKKKAASVLDLINSEISDLHMRELELKQLHSPPPHGTGAGDIGKDEQDNNEGSAEDEFEENSSGEDDFSDSAIEYDGFTTNGSHSSGQVSPSENLNEMINQHQGEVQQIRHVVDSSNMEQKGNDDVEEEQEQNEQEEEEKDKRGQQEGKRSEIKVRPLDEAEDRTIKFPVSDETPIEREIRLTREREEEFRQKNPPFLAICPPAPASRGTMSLPVMKPRDVSSRPENQPKAQTPNFPGSIATAAQKDIQLEMATARFKKEIEESMKREKELIRETRYSVSTDNEDDVNNEPVAPAPQPKEPEKNVEQQQPQKPVVPVAPQQTIPPTAAVAAENSNQSQLRKPTLAKLPIAKLPAARFFSPPAFNANKPSRITPVLSPIINKGNLGFPSSPTSNNAVGGSLPVGISRPSYSSFEKYIMQTSMNYMANKEKNNAQPNSPTATPEEPVKNLVGTDPGVVNKHIQFHIPEDPLRIVQKPSLSDEPNENEEEEKPKRKYIPAQDKIHKEIEELAMREKELNHARGKWKSTLDLPEALKDAEEEKEPLRRTTSTTQSTLSLNVTTSVSKDNISTVTIGAGEGPTDDVAGDNGESDNLNLLNVTSEDVRQVTRVKNPARRRHSLLINQWEERIRQQQQQNNKK